jgi:hypothetical protein
MIIRSAASRIGITTANMDVAEQTKASFLK